MKPNQAVPLLTTLAPALAVAPPLLIGGVIIVGLIWLLSDKDEAAAPPSEMPTPSGTETGPPSRQLRFTTKRIRREDLAEALEYGARNLTRGDAVTALQARGFGKTAAYKALSPDGKFGNLIEFTADGLVEWRG